MADAVIAYQTVSKLMVAGKVAYKLADKKVVEWAESEGITREEAWRRVGAEAKRRGDAAVERVSKLGVKAAQKGRPLAVPLLASTLVPGGVAAVPIVIGVLAVRKLRKPRDVG